jgi:hypothetical protein
MARRGMSARRGAVAALAALALALCAAPAAGSAGPALLAGRTAGSGADARAVTLPGDERAQRALLAAGGPRKLLLFGLTARDKAAHQEQRDAMIEVRAPAHPHARAAGRGACAARRGLPRVSQRRPRRVAGSCVACAHALPASAAQTLAFSLRSRRGTCRAARRPARPRARSAAR